MIIYIAFSIIYALSCILAYIISSMSSTFDEDFTVKNLVLTLFWPLTIWFLK